MTKYYIQFQHQCKHCKQTKDVLSRDDQEGLVMSRHFPSKDTLKFCVGSFKEFLR